MASPHVAGTAALIWFAHPDWTNDDVRLQLQSTARDLGAVGRDSAYGFGRVDAYRAASIPPTIVSVASITYSTGRAKNRNDLFIHVGLTDNFGGPVASASVTIRIYLDDVPYPDATKTTGTDGIVTFTIVNAPSGTYVTEVVEVTADGLAWDGIRWTSDPFTK